MILMRIEDESPQQNNSWREKKLERAKSLCRKLFSRQTKFKQKKWMKSVEIPGPACTFPLVWRGSVAIRALALGEERKFARIDIFLWHFDRKIKRMTEQTYFSYFYWTFFSLRDLTHYGPGQLGRPKTTWSWPGLPDILYSNEAKNRPESNLQHAQCCSVASRQLNELKQATQITRPIEILGCFTNDWELGVGKRSFNFKQEKSNFPRWLLFDSDGKASIVFISFWVVLGRIRRGEGNFERVHTA